MTAICNKNLKIANRSHVSCTHHTLMASTNLNITLWPWNVGWVIASPVCSVEWCHFQWTWLWM